MSASDRHGFALSSTVTTWLEAFEAALHQQDAAEAAALFIEVSHWRDLLAFTWQIQTYNGSAVIARALIDSQADPQAAGRIGAISR